MQRATKMILVGVVVVVLAAGASGIWLIWLTRQEASQRQRSQEEMRRQEQLVRLTKTTIELCRECRRPLGKKTERIYLPRDEAAKYRLPNGSYRAIEEQTTSGKLCDACQEKLDAKTKIPNLLGKNFKEIVNILGEPSRVSNDIINFDWQYDNKPIQGYSMRIDFLDYLHTQTRIGYPTRSSRAHIIITTGTETLATARAILSAKVLNDPPARIYFYPERNELLLKWHKGESPYWYDQTGPHWDHRKKFSYYAELTVTGGDQKIYTLNRWLDTNTGDYKQSYKVTADWKDCLVKEFEQADGCKGKYDLYEMEDSHCIRIK